MVSLPLRTKRVIELLAGSQLFRPGFFVELGQLIPVGPLFQQGLARLDRLERRVALFDDARLFFLQFIKRRADGFLQ